MTRVAILWHMHQPFYQDLLTGEHVLPWVRLHALKDYWGMVAILREFPQVHVTFNLVPSLLVQLQAFAGDNARDRHLELGLKPADQLTPEERAFCVQNFFHAHRVRMIDVYPRYRELLERRGDVDAGSARTQAARFSTGDLRDLQVWHKLAWIDAEYHDNDARIHRLVHKDRGFTEDDKAALRQVELELLRRVIPEYRDAARRGQVELSTSPFYHPILPLLCDTDVYLRTHPQSRMPREPFRHPEDAAEQLQRAVALHEELFGVAPQGLWPSEGSVSDAMAPLVAAAGLRWMATDEEILARTQGAPLTRDGDGQLLQPERLYTPYVLTAAGARVACGFRDHTLSDLIGFSYAGWSADGAADDFVYRLVTAGRRFTARSGGEEATIFVILDGENAWEHYDGQGRPFLRALYGRLSDHPEIQTVTMSEACATATATLPSIFPGSWIDGDFYIWIGHPDDHRAWTQLAEARRTLDAAAASASPAAFAQAREEMLVAEGSDWFWWYGDDHSSDHDREFDELFRRHVRNVYRALDRPVPEDLFASNITTQPTALAIQPPTGLIAPAVDGEITTYFEWIGAGCVDTPAAGGTMHQVEARPGLTSIEYGFSSEELFVRIDAAGPMRSVMAPDVRIRVVFLSPAGLQAVVTSEGARFERRTPGGAWSAEECAGLRSAVSRILEVAIPFRCLQVRPGARLALLIAIDKAGVEVEHHPAHGLIEVELPEGEFSAHTWTA